MYSLMTLEKFMNNIGLVNARTIPYEHQGSLDLTAEGSQEPDSFCGLDVFINMKAEIQPGA